MDVTNLREKQLESWSAAPGRLELHTGEVHVWRAQRPAGSPVPAPLRDLLSPEEELAAGRLVFPDLGENYRFAHAALRGIVSRYVDEDPGSIVIARMPHGKPYLRNFPWLQISLSHCGPQVAVGLASKRPIGIDIERVRDDVDVLALAEEVCSVSERAGLRTLSSDRRVAAFFGLWTRKEALLKADGRGLSFPPTAIDVLHSACEDALLLSAAGSAGSRRWVVRDIVVQPGYAGAVVVQEPLEKLAGWEWNPA